MAHFGLLRPVRGRLALAALFQAVASVLILLPALALIDFTGAWLSGEPAPGTEVVLAAIGGTIGSLITASIANLLTHRADADLTWHLQTRLAATIRRLPMPVITGHGAARIKKVVTDDTSALHYLVAHTLLDVTALLVTPIGGFIALALIDWRLAMASTIPLIAGILCFVLAMRGSGEKFAEYACQQRDINTAIVDFVSGLPTAKIYGGAGSARTHYRSAVRTFHDFFRAWSSNTSSITTASWLVVTPALTACLLTLAGAAGSHFGWATTTALVAGVLLGPIVSAPVAVVGPRLQAVRTAISALTSIDEFLSQRRIQWPSAEPTMDNHRACKSVAVRFEDVSYRYDSSNVAVSGPAVDGLSIDLPATGLVGVVGVSGSGKSTLVSLLARFIDPDDGQILIGGANSRELTEAQLYSHVGFVFQGTTLRRATLRDNLAAGHVVSDHNLIQAAGAAGIHEEILKLPYGYETMIGEDSELSGGQRQRVLLARALLRNPEILVLDEPTSAVDASTRRALMTTIRGVAAGRLVLLITHDIHTVIAASQILVLDQGKAAGVGTHVELAAKCEAYRRLLPAKTGPSSTPDESAGRIAMDREGE